jgi:hypothetical protein
MNKTKEMNKKQEKIITQFKIDNVEDLKKVSPELIESIFSEMFNSINRGNNTLILSKTSIPEPFHKKLSDLYLNIKAAN